MLALAKAASMSAGNFYHYFSSKEAIVLGIIERDRNRNAELWEELVKSGDQTEVYIDMVASYFTAMTRDAAILQVEIWAEATRNPAIADIVASADAKGRAWFLDTLTASAGLPERDCGDLYWAMTAMLRGMIVDRATIAEYDPKPALSRFVDMMRAGFAKGGPAD